MRRNMHAENKFIFFYKNSVFFIEFFAEIGEFKLKSAQTETLKSIKCAEPTLNKSAPYITVLLAFKHFNFKVNDCIPINILTDAFFFVSSKQGLCAVDEKNKINRMHAFIYHLSKSL